MLDNQGADLVMEAHRMDRGTEELLEGALAGCIRPGTREDVWEALRNIHADLSRTLHARLPHKVRAFYEVEDIVQEVWMTACQKLPHFRSRGDGSMRAWLRSIMHFRILQLAEKTERIPVRESDISGPSVGLTQSRSPLDAISDLPAIERWTIDLEMIAGFLPPSIFQAFQLRICSGLNGREAALHAGISESTISRRYGRALELCRARLRRAN